MGYWAPGFQLLSYYMSRSSSVCADSRPRRTWSEIRNQLLRATRIMIVDGQIRLWLRRKIIQINARDRPLVEHSVAVKHPMVWALDERGAICESVWTFKSAAGLAAADVWFRGRALHADAGARSGYLGRGVAAPNGPQHPVQLQLLILLPRKYPSCSFRNCPHVSVFSGREHGRLVAPPCFL